MIRAVEISECFPNSFKPQTGEFVLQHARAMSAGCQMLMIAPLRIVPPREVIKNGFRGIADWYSGIRDTDGFTEGNLTVEYMNYVSLPRPSFESVDEKMITLLFRNRLKQTIASFDPDIIINHWLRPWAGIAASIAHDLSVPLVIDHHEDLPTLRKLFPDNYKKFLEPIKKAESVIAHSTQNLSDLNSEMPDLISAELIHLGQNFPVTNSLKTFSNGCTNILCVSHLEEPRKNIDVLINSIALLPKGPKVSLTIAGDGSLRNEYQSLAEADDRISFAGSKDQDEIMKLLDEADLFVLPSYPEAFGIVFAEALARGVPVITCKGNGGGEELKLLGYPAVLSTPGDAKDLAQKISELISNRRLMSELSETGKKIVAENFTWEKNAKKTLDLAERVIGKYRQGHVRN